MMRLNNDEKKFLAVLVKKNLEEFKARERLLVDVDVAFLKAEHNLGDFLGGLLKKLN